MNTFRIRTILHNERVVVENWHRCKGKIPGVFTAKTNLEQMKKSKLPCKNDQSERCADKMPRNAHQSQHSHLVTKSLVHFALACARLKCHLVHAPKNRRHSNHKRSTHEDPDQTISKQPPGCKLETGHGVHFCARE